MKHFIIPEDFKPIPGTWANYYASPNGEIWSEHSGRKLNPWIHKGYEYITLCVDGKKTKRAVHSIVAEIFLPREKRKEEINHKDGNKANNCVSNLEWCTRVENVQHSLDTGLANQTGENHSQSKLNDQAVRVIKYCLSKSISGRKLAMLYKVSEAAISNIKHGKSWSHV